MARSDWEVSIYIDTVVEQVELRHKKNIERGKGKDDRAYGTLRHDRNGGQLAGRHLTHGLEMRSGGELWMRAYERAKLNVVMRVSRVNQKKVVVIESAPPFAPLIFLFSVSFRTVLMNPRIAVPEQETAKCSSRSSSVFTFQSGSYDTKGLDHLPTFSKDRRNTCTVYMRVSAYILQPQKTVPCRELPLAILYIGWMIWTILFSSMTCSHVALISGQNILSASILIIDTFVHTFRNKRPLWRFVTAAPAIETAQSHQYSSYTYLIWLCFGVLLPIA